MSFNRRWLAAAILGWTSIAWGGRIMLLAVGDDWFDIFRIGGSFVIGVTTALALWIPQRSSTSVLYGFSLWTALVWTRSMWVNWTDSGTLGFKLVHTVLAVGFFALAYAVWAVARRDSVSGPDQGDRDEQGQSETASIT